MSLEVIYLSNKKFKATSRGHEIIIDQPKEGKGDDTGMYPIEVFMSAFGACIGLYVNSFARRHEINTDEMKINFFLTIKIIIISLVKSICQIGSKTDLYLQLEIGIKTFELTSGQDNPICLLGLWYLFI